MTLPAPPSSACCTQDITGPIRLAGTYLLSHLLLLAALAVATLQWFGLALPWAVDLTPQTAAATGLTTLLAAVLPMGPSRLPARMLGV